jgi:hypothetical protein
MGYIEITDRTYRELLTVAITWRTTVTAALARLVAECASGFETDEPAPTNPATAPGATSASGTSGASGSEAATGTVAVFARHAGTRTKATFDPHTRAVTITSGPLTGQHFTTPTTAMCAVIINSGSATRGPGNGWRFWIVTATGQPIHSLRDRPARRARTSTGGTAARA